MNWGLKQTNFQFQIKQALLDITTISELILYVTTRCLLIRDICSNNFITVQTVNEDIVSIFNENQREP